MYAFESKVRYSEVGEDTRMTLYSVLNYFQDCSVFHSESVGRGTAVQEELGRAWVLTGWQIEFRRAADLGESIRISTWPHGFRGFVGERNFLMETLDGEVLACADSSWAYIDVKNRTSGKGIRGRTGSISGGGETGYETAGKKNPDSRRSGRRWEALPSASIIWTPIIM